MKICELGRNFLQVSPVIFSTLLVFSSTAVAATRSDLVTSQQNLADLKEISRLFEKELFLLLGRQGILNPTSESSLSLQPTSVDTGASSTTLVHDNLNSDRERHGDEEMPRSPVPSPSDRTLEQIDRYSQWSETEETDNAMGQVTSVSQLQDVRPSDWAYEALRNLVERYGAIAGYPDSTFRGNRSMTRYEFAAALQRALDQIQVLLARNENLVPQADIATLGTLTEQFVLELALLRGKVDAVTARTRDLELTQFSNTTKLNGEAIFGLTTIATGDDATGKKINTTTSFGHRTRLNFDTSFTGRDYLRTQLQAEGLGTLERRTLTPEGELAFTGATDNDAYLVALQYSFPIGTNTQVVIDANAGGLSDFATTVNPYFDGDGASGALSRFGTYSPIYNLGGGTGIGIQHAFNDKLDVSLGYLAGDAGNPNPGAGLFDSSYGAIAQVVFKPSKRSSIGLTYVRAYNNYLITGSDSANLLGLPATSNSYGVEASFQINPQFVLGGWAAYTGASVIDRGDASILTWAVTLAFPDLGKSGNLAGFLIGMEPKVTGRDDSLARLGINDPSISLHLEAFYQYQLTDNILITPGIIWLTAPDHNSANSDLVIGTVRTTFRF